MLRVSAFALAILVAAAPASAEQSEVERQAYEEFERASRFFAAEDYAAAAEHFEAAYRLVPSAAVHYNIARSYELAGVPDRAAEHYRAFLDARAGAPSRRRQVQARLDELAEGLGWVRVEADPEGVDLFVDDRPRGSAPATLALPPGRHVIAVESGERTGSVEVDVQAGGETSVQVVAEEPAPPPPPVEPVEPEDVGEEAHPGYGGGVERFGEPEERPRRRGIGVLHHGWFWATLALALGSGGALAGVGTTMLDLSAEYEGLLAIPPAERSEAAQARIAVLVDEGPQWELATTALWTSTGVLAGAAILVAVFTDWGALAGGPRAATEAPALGWMPRLEPAVAFAPR